MTTKHSETTDWLPQRELMIAHHLTFSDWDAINTKAAPLQYSLRAAAGGDKYPVYNPREVARRVNKLRKKNKMPVCNPIRYEDDIPPEQPEKHTPRRLRSIQNQQHRYDDGSTWQTQTTLMRKYALNFAEWEALAGMCPTPLKMITRRRHYGDHHALLYDPRQIARRAYLLRNRYPQKTNHHE